MRNSKSGLQHGPSLKDQDPIVAKPPVGEDELPVLGVEHVRRDLWEGGIDLPPMVFAGLGLVRSDKARHNVQREARCRSGVLSRLTGPQLVTAPLKDTTNVSNSRPTPPRGSDSKPRR